MKFKRWIFFAGFILLASASVYLWNNLLTLGDTCCEIEYKTQPASNPEDGSSILLENNPQVPESGAQSATLPATPAKGYHIHINLDEPMMYVFKDSVLVQTYPVSGGKASTPSPLGTWRIINKDTWGEGFGGAWLGFNVPWGKYGIHGTVYPWVIGKSNSSKGCIRMNNKDVRELYKFIPHGTTVTIVHANKKFRSLRSGDIGSDVAEIQKALQKLGYYNGGANGKFGASLKSSVIKFQKANKLYASGMVDRKTYDLILGKINAAEAQ